MEENTTSVNALEALPVEATNFPIYTNESIVLDPSFIHRTNCEFVNEPQVEFGIIMILLVIIGLIGNFVVIFIILVLQEYKKSVTNWYILQLSLADTLFLLMLPFTAHSEIVGKWIFSSSLCKFKEALLFINYYASIYFLVVMSFDRYLAITKAFVSKKWMSSFRSPIASYIFSIFGWILSVLLCIQLYTYSSVTDCGVCSYTFPRDKSDIADIFFRFDLYEDDSNYTNHDILQYYFDYVQNKKFPSDSLQFASTACGFFESQILKVWIYGNFVGAFCLPFIFICFFYGMIMSTITAASRVGNAERQRSYRRRVTMIVLALVTLFAVSWFPWYVDKLARLNGISLSRSSCRTLGNSVRVLAFFNSALNPYFYSFLGTHFRDRLNRASTRIGLSALRSRAASGSFMKKRKRSTSNSGGSMKPNSKNGALQPNENNLDVCNNDDPKFSVAQKTERTLV